jgi:hypothetical protein
VKHRNNKSGVAGVHLDKATDKWRAILQNPWHQKHLGLFNSLDKAKKVIIEAVDEMFGSFANWNYQTNK